MRGIIQTVKGFQSTLPVGGATGRQYFCVCDTRISIHAPRGGSDASRSALDAFA